MTKKNELSNYTEEEILEIAETLYGIERIRAYKIAGRADLEKEYANELLIAKDDHYGRGPCAFSPYDADNWEVLRQKKRFDKEVIFYDNEAIRDGLINTNIEVYTNDPSYDGIKNIEGVLSSYDINKEERIKFFVKLREKAKEKIWADEISQFVFGLKDTGYSNLAAHTRVSRKDVAIHYLDGLFTKYDLEDLVHIDDLSTKLMGFMEKEKIDGEEIVLRSINKIKNYKPRHLKLATPRDKASEPYYLIKELSKIPSLRFPRDFTIRTIENYVKHGGELWEGHHQEFLFILNEIKDDIRVRALCEKSLRKEIENGPVCLLDRVEYGVKEFGLNPKEGWLKKSLEKTLKKWSKTNEKFELSAAIYIGRKYELLSNEEIEKLERKLDLIERLKKV